MAMFNGNREDKELLDGVVTPLHLDFAVLEHSQPIFWKGKVYKRETCCVEEFGDDGTDNEMEGQTGGFRRERC